MITDSESYIRMARIILGFALMGGACAAQAAKTCAFDGTLSGLQRAQSFTAALQGGTSVGADVNPGPAGNIYSNVMNMRGFAVRCSGAESTARVEATVISSRPAVSPQPVTSGLGTVYETNVSGVGVAFSLPTLTVNGTTVLDAFGAPGFADYTIGTGSVAFNGYFSVYARLVKTGPVSPGVILGSDLPRLEVRAGGLKLFDVSFTGSMQMVSLTCTTGTETVNLRDHAASTFTGAGTGSPLVDFDINLQNCPALYGYTTASNSFVGEIAPVPIPGVGGNSSNGIYVSFAVQAPRQAAPGVLKLSAPTPGNSAAQNIGIEIRRRGQPSPVAFNTLLYMALPLSSVPGSYKMPFSARYVQLIDGPVIPGQANGTVEFLVRYN